MKRNFIVTAVIGTALFLAACGGGKSSPESVAKKWCDLNSKVAKAGTDAERSAAMQERKNYENEIEQKHKADTTFMAKVEAEIENCENTSEGK